MSTEDQGRGNVRPALPIGVRPLSERYSARMCTVETDQVKFLLALHHYSRARRPANGAWRNAGSPRSVWR